MTVKVSVVVPIYNVEQYLHECMDSILAQSLQDIEIICVDDGSTDASGTIAHEYAKRDARVRILSKENAGYGAAVNDGFDVASGEYIGIVEPDDFIEPAMFETLYRAAKEHNLDFVKSDFYRFTTERNGKVHKTLFKLTGDKSRYRTVFNPSEDPSTLFFVMNTWSRIYKRSFINEWHIRHNESPGASFQDNGFWFQTFMRAKRAMILPQSFYMNRRDNPNSSVFSTNKTYAMAKEYDYIRAIIEKDKDNLGAFLPYCNYYRYINYRYNTLKRIPPEDLHGFLYYIGEEFKTLAEAYELDPAIFGASHWQEVQ